jgi:hypothetical protein
VANGLVGASLFPAGPGRVNSPESWYVHVLVIAACPLFGWYVDRRRGGAKVLMGASAVFLLFAPILNALADSPLLYSGILAVGSLAQFAMLITVITVLAGQGTGLAWYGAAYLFHAMLRIAPFLGFFLVLKIPALDGGVALVIAMTAAVSLLSQCGVWRMLSTIQSDCRTSRARNWGTRNIFPKPPGNIHHVPQFRPRLLSSSGMICRHANAMWRGCWRKEKAGRK